MASRSVRPMARSGCHPVSVLGPPSRRCNRPDRILPSLIEIRKLCGLAADQGATALFARFRESGNQLIENRRVKTFSADIVEKKQRARTGHRDIVDAMVHEILGDCCVPAERDRNFKLRANPIDTRHENRFLHSPEIRPEQPAKSTDASEDFRTKRGTHSFLQTLS